MKIKPIVYLDLYVTLNTKSLHKAKKILMLIKEKLDKTVFVTEVYQSDLQEFTAICHLELEYHSDNDSIVESLILLDLIGDKWTIECPNFSHQEYWKFRGMRSQQNGNFKINGIQEINFELTNNEFDRTIDFVI